MIIVTMHKAEVSWSTFYLFVLCQYKVYTLYSLCKCPVWEASPVVSCLRTSQASEGSCRHGHCRAGWLLGAPHPEAMYDH